MRARGDLAVLHEPFMYHYYLTQTERLFPNFDPEPGHPRGYRDIRAMILGKAEKGPVFFKDMAYYVLNELPPDKAFLSAMSHAFLVRDPAEAILSYHRLDPGFACAELGIEAQFRLYSTLLNLGHDPFVITSDQLRLTPEATLARYWEHIGLPFAAHAFQWDDTVPDEWKPVEGWHADVLALGAIKPPEPDRDAEAELAVLGEPFISYDRHHRPFYETLCKVANTRAHQK